MSAVITGSPDDAPLWQSARRGMLARLASDLAVIANPYAYEWTCCYADFDHVNFAGRTEHWGWRFCNGGWPGYTFRGEPCGHWHHRYPPILLG